MRYRKTSGKSNLRIGGEKVVVEAGQIVEVAYGEIPAAFLDTFEALDPIPPPPEEQPPPAEYQLRVVERPGRRKGLFDVVNPVTGQTLNTEPLTREQAEEIAGAPAGEDKEPGREDA
jgi:hypothetical protein